jgi:tripartite-type tricarboxylate transporter receptor subunit TctC
MAARSGAPLIQDRSTFSVCYDPGSAAHHCMLRCARDTRPLQRALFAVACTAVALFVATPALAQSSVENFYRGQTVRIVVASGPSGGFDTFARLLSRHLGRFVPGNPTFVVQNMPGAGGLRAAGYIAKVAAPDGLTMAAVQGGMVKAPLLGLVGADYDATKLRWIGNLNSEVHTCVAWHTSGMTTIKEAMQKELIVGASAGADSELAPNAFNSLIGTKFKIIPGYQDGPRILLAMQRAEVLGRCGWSWSSVVSQHPEWVRDKTVSTLVQWPTKHADLPNLPLAQDLATNADGRRAIDFLFGHLVMSRSYVLPAGVTAERINALRAGFDAMVKDEAVKADFVKANHELAPMSGAEVNALVDRIYATPKHVIDKALAAIGGAKR